MDTHFENALAALSYAGEQDKTALDREKTTAVYYAQDHQFFNTFKELFFIQPIYSEHIKLLNSGFSVFARMPKRSVNRVIYFAQKHKEKTFADLADIADYLSENGILLFVAPKAIGGRSIAEWVIKLFGQGEIISKRHSVVCAVRKSSATIDRNILNIWQSYGQKKIVEGGYFTRAGVFSSERIDQGSKILIETIANEALDKEIADFGAGYGYISKELLNRYSNITKMALYEADYNALELAKENIIDKRSEYHWSDITDYSLAKRFDAVVMNPPFHSGYKKDSAVGEAFIKAAAKALKKDGRLYLVANRKLGYETLLKELFNKTLIMCQKDGYKVIKCHLKQ
ncbi:MAG: methyltransferase [Helicobacteraceae bacterium]|jgi:16S rRNA (guanine1207-N2)-methyltransferase|nr:methyltransferase [Helicobacteraceae bacterium]